MRASGPGGGRTSSSGPLTGTVKFYDTARGYGFLSGPNSSDVFVHNSQIRGVGPRGLRKGQRVRFEIAPGRRGTEARNVAAL